MEEQEEKGSMVDAKYTRKLDFNVPLLSIRRPGGITGVAMSRTNSQATSRDTSNRVPFSWELAPGKPKDRQRNDTSNENLVPPKLPPSRWHLSKEATVDGDDCFQHHDHDDGCDGDVDDDGCDGDVDDDGNDVFSDAIDKFSLSGSIDTVETTEKFHGLDGSGLNRVGSSGNQFPNFIIQRFLPAAKALAASSVLTVSKNSNKKLSHRSNYLEECFSQTRRSYSSPRGCGLGTLFPWRMKHKLCAIKSPVREASSNLKSQSSARRRQDSKSAKFREGGS